MWTCIVSGVLGVNVDMYNDGCPRSECGHV